MFFFFFQAEDGIRDKLVTGVQTCALPIWIRDELEAGVRYLRRFGCVAAVGISLGGRLALMSSADCMAAISPAVGGENSPPGQRVFGNFPPPPVRGTHPCDVFGILDRRCPVSGHEPPCLRP